MPTIHVAHSPDSDDAFMFWALASDKIDTGDRTYVHELADIETLNRRALKGELEVTAVSVHAYAGNLAGIGCIHPRWLGDNGSNCRKQGYPRRSDGITRLHRGW